MNKLEVGMYARTTELYGGLISHITKVCKETKTVMLYSTGVAQYPFNEIEKVSHNIIDLIEVGDYVNGSKVSIVESEYIYWETGNAIHYKYIETIVTKEQFKSMEYRLGE